MQTYIKDLHENIQSWTSQRARNQSEMHMYRSNKIVQLNKWGPVRSYEEAIRLKLIEDKEDPEET